MVENTSKYCSQIIVVHVHAFFSKVHPACHNIANGIKPGTNSAADCSKAVCWGRKVIYVRCMSCSYNNVAKGIRLLDKKAIFAYTGKNVVHIRAFERYIPLISDEFG